MPCSALIPCLFEILALLWVPVIIPDYLEREALRDPFEDVVLGFIAGIALAYCAYMFYLVRRIGQKRDIIPRFQTTTVRPEKA